MPENNNVRSITSAFGDITKTGSIDKTKGSDIIDKKASFDTSSTSAMWYSPELTSESWLLPKSRQEILKWCRIFFNLEPYVQSIIMMHAYYPFSKFDLITPDKSVTEFYQEMAFNENFDLYQFMMQASLSYNKFGEAVCFGNLEEIKDGPWSGKKRWSKFILLEPELVEIKQALFEESGSFELIPTEEMKKLVRTMGPQDAEKSKIPQVIIQAIQNGKNIPLDPRAVSAIQRITDPSATRGTPMIQCIFKALIYQDKIRLAQMAAADRYHFPVELWTIGDLATNILPSEDELASMRTMINQAIQNPPFSLVFPPIIKYEALGVSGKLLPVGEDYDYIQDQIMVGLGVNKNIITGDGPSFSNMKAMSLQKLVMVYKAIRDQFENWMINRFFRPIAIENGFYYYSGKTKKLILPQISWYKNLDIEAEEEERKSYIDLHKDGYISTKTLFSKFPNLDYDTEVKHLETEANTIFDKKNDRIPQAFANSGVATGRESPIAPSSEEGPTITGPGLEEKTETKGPGEETTKPAPFETAPAPTTPPATTETTTPTPATPAVPGV